MDRRFKPSRIAEVILETKPDVIGLQEVLSIEGGPPEMRQAQYLAERTGMNLAIGEVRQLYGGTYGNIVLSRYPVRGMCTYDISVAGREKRGCMRADVLLPDGQVLHVFNVHLGTAFAERKHQGRKLVEQELLRSRELVGPRVVVGDFNEWTRGVASQLLTAEFTSADIRLHLKQKVTYPGVFPVLHLDHIYYDRDLIVERVVLHRTLKSLVASDHLPLCADFVLRSEAERSDVDGAAPSQGRVSLVSD
jgi:endonuclease/exonuclease/phosphatase family metal-dependent hydrolase